MGRNVGIYLPNNLWERIERLQKRRVIVPVSLICQEALSRALTAIEQADNDNAPVFNNSHEIDVEALKKLMEK